MNSMTAKPASGDTDAHGQMLFRRTLYNSAIPEKCMYERVPMRNTGEEPWWLYILANNNQDKGLAIIKDHGVNQPTRHWAN